MTSIRYSNCFCIYGNKTEVSEGISGITNRDDILELLLLYDVMQRQTEGSSPWISVPCRPTSANHEADVSYERIQS